jgi:hypothetical protein
MFQQMPSTIVPFSNLPDGLYLVKRPSQYPLIEHYGVLIVGQPLRSFGFGIYDYEPVILHRTDLGVRADWASELAPVYILGQVPSHLIPLAIDRFSAALQENDYALFTNNCEHFARFVTEGKSYSTQVAAAVVSAGVVGLIWALNRGNG